MKHWVEWFQAQEKLCQDQKEYLKYLPTPLQLDTNHRAEHKDAKHPSK